MVHDGHSSCCMLMVKVIVILRVFSSSERVRGAPHHVCGPARVGVHRRPLQGQRGEPVSARGQGGRGTERVREVSEC